jgi:hypothetical protein
MQAGKDFVFTYGPLGFIKLPLYMGNNIAIALILTFIFRIYFIAGILMLSAECAGRSDLFSFFAAYILISFFRGVDYIIIGIILTNIFLFEEKGKTILVFILSLCVVLGFLIKINIGITGALIVVGYLIYNFIKKKNLKVCLLFLAFFITNMILIWGLIYHSFIGIFHFIRNIFIVSTANLSDTSLNAPNNWWLLSTAFILLFLFPIIVKDKKIDMLFFISPLALFAVFKYAFAREENYHMLHLFLFMVLIVSFCVLLYSSIRPFHIIWLLLPLLFYNLNMQLSGSYNLESLVEYMGINNFRTSVLNFKELKIKSRNQSLENIQSNKLPDSFLKKIGYQSIDCYPWELSYVFASGLNYKPRPLFQLGSANSLILDNENAAFMRSPSAPQFILWHPTWCSDKLCGIDGRYLLNEDFNTLFEIFNNYQITDSAQSVFLMEHTEKNRLEKPVKINSMIGKWDEWITVPPTDSNEIVIAKIKTAKNFLGKLKAALYKEQEYDIAYELADGKIIYHRFIRSSGEGGTWITPYLFHLSDNFFGVPVHKIKLIASDNTSLLENNISIDWELIKKKYKTTF